MKNKLTKIFAVIALVLIAPIGVLLTGCGEKELIDIGLSKEIKTSYFVGDSIDFNDAKLVLTYSNDSQSEITLTTSMVTGFDSSTAGDKTLKISYNGKEISVNYTVLDFTTVYNKVSDDLLAKDKFVANMRRYDSETSSWYNYNKYTKYNNYFKEEDLTDSESVATIYDLSANQYVEGNGIPSTTDLTKEEIYSYAYAFIAKTAQISNTSISKIDNGYKLTYQLNEDSTIFEVETTVDETFAVKTIVVKLSGVSVMEMTYSYDGVPALAMPTPDFVSAYNKVGDDLLAKDKFVAIMKRYDGETGWYDYNKYTKYNNYFKDEDLTDDESLYMIYNLTTKQYTDGKNENTTTESKEEIYSYAYAFIAKTAQISNTSISKVDDGYKLTYQLTDEDSTYTIETTIDETFAVKTIVVKLSEISIMEMTYSYENVPTITWPAN